MEFSCGFRLQCTQSINLDLQGAEFCDDCALPPQRKVEDRKGL